MTLPTLMLPRLHFGAPAFFDSLDRRLSFALTMRSGDSPPSIRKHHVNQLRTYLESGTYVGLDQYLILQRKLDGAIAAKLGLTALAPMGALVGLVIGYLVFA